MKIPDQDYALLTNMIQKRSGLHFDAAKEFFIRMRVAKRMAVHNYSSVIEYLYLLNRDLAFEELDTLIESLTTTETYFYRELNQLITCMQGVLPMVMKTKRNEGCNTIRFWSAGCSIGCEPYTIALLLKETVADLANWDVQIVGTDINIQALHHSRQGVYLENTLKETPPLIKKKYFQQVSEKKWEISQDIKNMVEFKQINLTDRQQVSSMNGFDFVFCRNVIIYFDKSTSQDVLNMFHKSINPGGYIFLGHSESLSRFTDSFKPVRLNDSVVYQRS